jgi:hypothetical protein
LSGLSAFANAYKYTKELSNLVNDVKSEKNYPDVLNNLLNSLGGTLGSAGGFSASTDSSGSSSWSPLPSGPGSIANNMSFGSVGSGGGNLGFGNVNQSFQSAAGNLLSSANISSAQKIIIQNVMSAASNVSNVVFGYFKVLYNDLIDLIISNLRNNVKNPASIKIINVVGFSIEAFDADGVQLEKIGGGVAAFPVSELIDENMLLDKNVMQKILNDIDVAYSSFANDVKDQSTQLSSAITVFKGLAQTAGNSLMANQVGVVADGPGYFKITDYTSGELIYSGRLDEVGKYYSYTRDGVFQLDVYYPLQSLYGSKIIEVSSGNTSDEKYFDSIIPGVMLTQVAGVDADLDGIPDYGEKITGTNVSAKDTDGDGVTDLAEIEAGTDPLGGLGFPTGVLSSVILAGNASSVAIATSPSDATKLTAYVAKGTEGVSIIDVSKSTKPTVLSTISLSGDNTSIAINSTRGIAAVAAGSAGLHLLDVSNANQPIRLQTLVFPAAANAVQIRDDQAFVATGANLVVVDILTGEIIQTIDVGSLGGGVVNNISVEGDLLYLTDSANTLRSFRFDGKQLTALGFQIFTVGGGKLFVGGGVAYIGRDDGFNGGYSTVDVTDPINMKLISDPDINNIAGSAIAVNGSGLAVSIGRPGGVAGTDALDLLNVVDSSKTDGFISRIMLPATPRDVVIANGMAFVADGAGGLQIVNFTGVDTKGIAPSISIQVSASDADLNKAGTQVIEGSSIQVLSSVTDDVQVKNLDLLVNGVQVSKSVTYPFQLSAIIPSIATGGGQVTLQVRATDMGGNSTLSNSIVLDVLPDVVLPEIKSSIAEGAVDTYVNSIDFTASESLDLSKLTPSGVHLIKAGADGVLGTADDVEIATFWASGLIDSNQFSGTRCLPFDH